MNRQTRLAVLVLLAGFLVAACQAENEDFRSLADALSITVILWVGLAVAVVGFLAWLASSTRPR